MELQKPAKIDVKRPVDRGAMPIGIELRHLRYYLAVNEELHFGRAAEKLHIAQPPLSQAIRKLEDELGVLLLRRTSRVVTPTEAGRIFAEEARKVLASFDFAVVSARRAGGVGSALRIGCLPHIPIERLFQFLEAVHERDPESGTQVTHLPQSDQVRGLRAGDLDVGIFHHAEDYADLEVEPLFPGEPLAAFLAPGHRLAATQKLRPDDLRDEVWITFPREINPALYDRMKDQFERAGYRFRKVYETGGTNARDLLLAAADSRGVTFGPSSLREVSETGGIVIRRSLEPALSMPDTVVAWRSDPPRHPEILLDSIRDVARELRLRSDSPSVDGTRRRLGRLQ